MNGEGPYEFIVDTGATLTLVFSHVAEGQSFAPAEIPARRILGLNSEQEVELFRIGEINVGGEALTDHVGAVLADWTGPISAPGGVLGLDFLSRYFMVVDAETQTISFYDPNATPPKLPSRWRSTELNRRLFKDDIGPLYTVTGRIQGRDIEFILDLGASTTLMNYPALRTLLGGVRYNDSGSGSPTNASRLSDITGDTSRARLIRLPRLRVGRTRWATPVVLIFNASVFDELGLRYDPIGVLGADLMAQRSFAIDFKNERIHISRKRSSS